MSPKQTLENLVKADQSLIKVGVSLFEDFNGETVLDELNDLGDDFETSLSIYCKITGEKNLLCWSFLFTLCI